MSHNPKSVHPTSDTLWLHRVASKLRGNPEHTRQVCAYIQHILFAGPVVSNELTTLSNVTVPMIGRLISFLSLALLVAGARRSSLPGHAFIPPAAPSCSEIDYSPLPFHAPRTRGVKQSSRGIKGLKLSAAAKGGSKKKKAAKKKKAGAKPDVENFKKSELVASIAEKTGLTKVASEEALQAMLETISEVSYSQLHSNT